MQKKRVRISLTVVRGLPQGGSAWDDTLRGFVVRRQIDLPVFYAIYRCRGRQKWYALGKFGAMTPELARREAAKVLALAAQGRDPAAERDAERNQMTVEMLCQQYVSEATEGRLLRRGKPKKSIKDDAARCRNHVVPLIGRLHVSAVTRMDVERLLHSIAGGRTAKVRDGAPVPLGGRGVASRTLAMLSGIFSYARKLGIRDDNPCQFVESFQAQRRTRRLSDIEYAKLGAALQEHDAIVKFLALTGWRSGEARELTWAEVDISRRIVNLRDTKTGPSTRILSAQAVAVLQMQPRFLHSDLVFPGFGYKTATCGLFSVEAAFRRVRQEAGLPSDITPHTLRHSFGSTAGDVGLSQFIIAALLGHKVPGVTSGYVHLSDPALILAADTIGTRISMLMDAGVVAEAAD
jgi:integrase